MLDLVLVLAFVAYSVSNGLRSRKRASRGPAEYFLAGRTLAGWQSGLSMAATQYAADTPLLVTGLVATAGIFSLWRLWIYAISFLLMGFALAGPWRRSGVITDAELAELRYAGEASRWLRYIKAVYFGTIVNCVVLAMVLMAATRIAEPFLPWHDWLPRSLFEPIEAAVEAVGVPLTAYPEQPDLWARSASNVLSILGIVAFVTLYSATGGLRSVVATDVVQISIALLATAAYAAVVTREVGGLAAIRPALARLYGSARASEMLAFTPSAAAALEGGALAVIAIQWLAQMNSDGTGYLAQRAMGCRSDADARLAPVVFTVTQIVVRSLLWLPVVLGLMILYPVTQDLGADEAARAATEANFVKGVAELLPAGLRGLMLVGLLAALASTVDTHLNWGASYWANDLYGRLWCWRIRGRGAGNRELVWVARLSNLVIVALALLIMANLGSIQDAWKTSLLFGAATGVPLLLRWFWHRQTAWGEIAPMATALVAAPLLLHFVESEATRLLAMAALGAAVSIAASLLTKPEPIGHLVVFYTRARPPGVWAPVARAAGAGACRSGWELARALAATAIASLSIFCLLVGTGSYLVGGTPPQWFPYAGLWTAANIGAGLTLVPVWWRLGGCELSARKRKEPLSG